MPISSRLSNSSLQDRQKHQEHSNASDEIGGLIGIFVVFILPILIWLIFVIKAEALVRSRLRFLSEYGGEDLEPSGCAVTMYQMVGWFFILTPVLVFLVILMRALNQPPY